MFILALTISTLLLITIAVVPIRRWHADRTQLAFEEDLYAFKLRAIRKFYPELRKLTYTEISEKYDVDHAYFNLR